MSRRLNVIVTPAGPMFVTETGTRTNAVGGAFLSETVSVATGTWKSTNGLLSASTKTVNGLAKASIKRFGGLTP